jgi:hypothetical protein
MNAISRSNIAHDTSAALVRHQGLDSLVEEERFSNVFYLRDGAFQVEGLGEDDLEDLAGVSADQDKNSARCVPFAR